MDVSEVRVLHVDSERGWRGGQQQAAYLFEKMHSKGFHTAMVSKPGSAMESWCKEKKLPFYSVPMRGELDFSAGYRIAVICRKMNCNVLHLHSAHALATGLWARLFNRSLRLVAVRRVDFSIRKNFFSRFKYTTPLVDKIVCISDGVKKVLVEAGIDKDRLVTIHSGIDLNRFKDVVVSDSFRKEIGIPDGHLVLGTVAAISTHKDYPNFLHAAAKVLKSHDNVTFCAVGDGPDKKAVHELAAELGLEKKIIFTGFRKDVGCFLKIFDIFVLASYLEGLGTSILDAQALGLPVIACRTGGIPEAVFDGDNGVLVPPENSDALADAISDMINDSEKRKRMGKRASETVQAFSINSTVEKNIALYKSILNVTS